MPLGQLRPHLVGPHPPQVYAHTSVLLGQIVRHLPVVIAVEDAVGDADVIGCHLVNALGDADDGGWGQGIDAGEAALRPHGAGGRRVGRHGGWASSAPGRREVEKPEWRGWEQARRAVPPGQRIMQCMAYCVWGK